MERTPTPWKVGNDQTSIVAELKPEQCPPDYSAESYDYYGGFLVAESIMPANLRYILELVEAAEGQPLHLIRVAKEHRQDVIKWERLLMELVGHDGLGSVREEIERRNKTLETLAVLIRQLKKEKDSFVKDWASIFHLIDKLSTAVASEQAERQIKANNP